jgi:hypothetical protein
MNHRRTLLTIGCLTICAGIWWITSVDHTRQTSSQSNAASPAVERTAKNPPITITTIQDLKVVRPATASPGAEPPTSLFPDIPEPPDLPVPSKTPENTKQFLDMGSGLRAAWKQMNDTFASGSRERWEMEADKFRHQHLIKLMSYKKYMGGELPLTHPSDGDTSAALTALPSTNGATTQSNPRLKFFVAQREILVKERETILEQSVNEPPQVRLTLIKDWELKNQARLRDNRKTAAELHQLNFETVTAFTPPSARIAALRSAAAQRAATPPTSAKTGK